MPWASDIIWYLSFSVWRTSLCMVISRSICVASNGIISFSEVIQYLSFSDLFLESPLDCREFKPVHPKGSQLWIFMGRIDAEAETPILWPPDGKSWLIGKDPNAGKDGRREEKGTTEDEMVGWHHWLNGHEFEQALGVGDGQGSLACCSPWGGKE